MANDKQIEQKIIDAAKVVFMKKGFTATKMQDVADKAEISRTSLNYYFRSKEKLFDQVVEQLINIFAPRILKVIASDIPSDQKLDLLVDEYTDLIIENPQYPHFIIGEITRDPDAAVEIFMKRIREPSSTATVMIGLRQFLPVSEDKTEALQQFMVSFASLFITPTLIWPAFHKITGTEHSFESFLLSRKPHIKSSLHSLLTTIITE